MKNAIKAGILCFGLAISPAGFADIGADTGDKCVTKNDLKHAEQHLADMKAKLEQVRSMHTSRSRYRKLIERQHQELEKEVTEMRSQMQHSGECAPEK